jgi:glycine oxidase
VRTHPTDVAVIGAGVAGLGVAWRAAQRGLAVTVLDPAPGSGASHVAAGMIAPVTEVAYGEEAVLGVHLASAGRWPRFAAELEEATGMSVGYRAHGTLAVAFDADDLRSLADLHAFQRSLGLDAEALASRECRDLEPALAPGVRGGLHVPGDHQVDTRPTWAALLAAAEGAGASLRPERVEGVVVEGDRAVGVRLGDGALLPATTVVLAAGSWSGGIIGVPPEAVPPVRPVKGQILRLRGPERPALLGRTVRGVVAGGSVYLVPRADGRLVVGATVEEQGFDTTVTAEAVYELLRDALRLVPGVATLELVEASAGLRPGTPDNAPLLGPSLLDGLVLATGHYRHGFLLLPVTADGIGEYLASGVLPDDLAPLSPHRFVGHGVGA